MHFPLVGLSFRPKEAKDFVKTLGVGDRLYLQRDPDNEYDPNAIKVVNRTSRIIEDQTEHTYLHLGFVPATVAADGLADRLDDIPTVDIPIIVAGLADPKKPTLFLAEDAIDNALERVEDDAND